MQIEVIERLQRQRWQEPLRQAFALRHQVFVDAYGWEFLRRPDGLDVDHHDDGDATHVLALDGDTVGGHIRLIPGGYLVVSRADPVRLRQAAGNAALFGLSRLCIDPAIRRRDMILFWLAAAAFDRALEFGAGALLFDTDPRMVLLLRLLGLPVVTVGEAVPAGQRMMQPVVMRLAPSIIETVRRNLISRRRSPVPAEAVCFAM
jgi:N-acyl-L-homoserine lactone synthetase